MPQIELGGDGRDSLWILATAKFPDDQSMRRHFCAIKFAERKLSEDRNEHSVEVSPDLLEDLLNAPSISGMRSLDTAATKAGFVAGSFLASIFHMCSFPEVFHEPSIRKAIVISQAFAKKSKFGDRSRMPVSENTIRKNFKDFRSVAHLWAALWLHQVFPMRDQREVLGSPEAINDFLGIAGLVQDFGCAFIPQRAKPRQAILDPSSIWSVPRSAQRLVPPWKGPSEWMLRVLRDYKARSSTY